jgi:hypothetical protein
MLEDDHRRRAIHPTPTSALRAVAVLLAVVLLLAAATMILDALSAPLPPGTAAEDAARPVLLVDVQSVLPAAGTRP